MDQNIFMKQLGSIVVILNFEGHFYTSDVRNVVSRVSLTSSIKFIFGPSVDL